MTPITLTAQDARRLVLHLQGLTRPPHRKLSAPAQLDLIEQLGFVQVDSIPRVERAHHMILFARNQTYRPKHLRKPLEVEGALFENWTHDAAIIPTRFYPFWHERFRRERARLAERFRRWQGDGYRAQIDSVLDRLEAEGPLKARDFADGKKRGVGWWDWHPGKAALEFLWRTGEIAIARRDGFQKVYDLAHRVIPETHRAARLGAEETVDWACRTALDRLGFGSPGDIAGFWGLITAAEAKAWCAANLGRAVVPALVEGRDGGPKRKVFAPPDIESRLQELAPAPARLRVLNPFDPILRDRKRLNHLFGFDYRIEIFVPAAQRRYGYYIFPLLEGERMVGRADIRADREADRLHVEAVWPEPGRGMTAGRTQRLEAELDRARRFAGLGEIRFAANHLRPLP